MSKRKEQFTPGPWKYDTKSSMIDAETGETIGEIFDYDDLKNGPLAAAAPEMYYLLKELGYYFQFGPERDSERGKYYLQQIEELLKKARGEE